MATRMMDRLDVGRVNTLLRLCFQSRWYQRHPERTGRQLRMWDLRPGYTVSDEAYRRMTTFWRRVFKHLRWKPTKEDEALLEQLNEPSAVEERRRVAKELKEKRKRKKKEWEEHRLQVSGEIMLEAMEKHGPAVIRGLRIRHGGETLAWSSFVTSEQLERLNALQAEWRKATEAGLDLTEDFKDQMVSLFRAMARTVAGQSKRSTGKRLFEMMAMDMGDFIQCHRKGEDFHPVPIPVSQGRGK